MQDGEPRDAGKILADASAPLGRMVTIGEAAAAVVARLEKSAARTAGEERPSGRSTAAMTPREAGRGSAG